VSVAPQSILDVEDEAARLRGELVESLVHAGDLNDTAWRAAFASVPRHVFVPRWFRTSLEDGRLRTEVIDDSHPEWLATVYADQPLQTRRDVTSSSTTPGLMALMLEALDITGAETALEIGTGTGYNAALLSERLGSERVTSIDIDPELIDEAQARLDRAGYSPTVSVGDGADGYPSRAPYDRILATCRVDSIPQKWLDQLTERGVIVAPLGVGIVRITWDNPTDTGSATGRFLPSPAYFMPLRLAPTRADLTPAIENARCGNGQTRRIVRDCGVFSVADARSWLEFAIPGIVRMSHNSDDLVYHPDGSWARLRGDTATQGGPRMLWDEVEAAHAQWLNHGSPGLDRYGLTVTRAHQSLWLDHPGHVVAELR
jgi:protein-L-isoaspartate(D-aspartate) O-methyltransferase